MSITINLQTGYATRSSKSRRSSLFARLFVAALGILLLVSILRTSVSTEPDHGHIEQQPSFAEYLLLALDPVPVPVAADSKQLLWLTIADAQWFDTVTTQLVHSYTRFAQAKDTTSTTTTPLVILCLDEGCIELCRERRGWACYAGFRQLILDSKSAPREWTKAVGILEALRTGFDVLYIESDTFLTRDALPYFEQASEADLIAGRSSTDTLNTNLMLARTSTRTVDLFEKLVATAQTSSIKIQDELNEMLGTSERRLVIEDTEEGRLPVPFDSASGIKVQTLPSPAFRVVNYLLDETHPDPSETVALQLVCAGDLQLRVFLAQSQGFWPDARHYSSGRKILKIDQLRGTVEEVQQMMRILVTAAHYTHRALEPPASVYFTDLELERAIYTAFPITRIAKNVGFHLVEPNFIEHAKARAVERREGGHIRMRLRRQQNEADEDALWPENDNVVLDEDLLEGPGGIDESLDSVPLTDDMEVRDGELETRSAELDMRFCDTLADLLHRLTSFSYAHEHVLTLTSFGSAARWRRWDDLPPPVALVTPCRRLDLSPNCGNICRRNLTEEASVKKGRWPPLWELMAEPGVW